MSNFDYAGNMTEAILLGNVAMLAGGKFKWDAKKLKTSRKDANKLIERFIEQVGKSTRHKVEKSFYVNY